MTGQAFGNQLTHEITQVQAAGSGAKGSNPGEEVIEDHAFLSEVPTQLEQGLEQRSDLECPDSTGPGNQPLLGQNGAPFSVCRWPGEDKKFPL